MARLREEAQRVLIEGREGIAWIVVWKTGRSWNCEAFYPDYDEKTGAFAFDECDLEAIDEIRAADPLAAIVNSCYCNLGECEIMTRDSLACALRWQYDLGHNRLADHTIRLQ